jgi:hypothetical protein
MPNVNWSVGFILFNEHICSIDTPCVLAMLSIVSLLTTRWNLTLVVLSCVAVFDRSADFEGIKRLLVDVSNGLSG